MGEGVCVRVEGRLKDNNVDLNFDWQVGTSKTLESQPGGIKLFGGSRLIFYPVLIYTSKS